MKKRTDKKMKVRYERDFDGVDPKHLREIPREIMADFLPSPEEVARSLKKAKITILLDDDTIKKFQEDARRHNVSYQKMIRLVLRKYVEGLKRAA